MAREHNSLSEARMPVEWGTDTMHDFKQFSTQRERMVSRLLVALNEFEQPFSKMETYAGMLALIVILVCVFLSILFRAFVMPLPNLGEWALVAMVPLTFFGGALCSALRKHISVDLAASLPYPSVVLGLRFVGNLAVVLFCVYFLQGAWDYLVFSYVTSDRLTDLNTPVWLPLACMVVGVGCMLLHTLVDLLRCVIEPMAIRRQS